MNFTTRILLIFMVWASICYAMAFSIPPNLLLYWVVRCVAYLFLIASFLIPVCLGIENRRFWLASCVSAIGLIFFAQTNGFSDPIAGLMAMFVSRELGIDELTWPGAGEIGHWMAIYGVIEINLIIFWSIITGWIWQKLDLKTPLWIVGVWAFFWVLTFSIEWTNQGHHLFGTVVVQLTVIAFAAMLLPGAILFDNAREPFWPGFAIAGYLVCALVVPIGPEGYAIFASGAITNLLPTAQARLLGELALLLVVPLGALIVASTVHFIVASNTKVIA